MSLLCKFTCNKTSFLLDPDLIEKVEEDISDDTCLLYLRDGSTKWVDGGIKELLPIINAGRTFEKVS